MPIPPTGPRLLAGRRRLAVAAAAAATSLGCAAGPAVAGSSDVFAGSSEAFAGSGMAATGRPAPGAPRMAAEDRDRLGESGVVADIPGGVPAPPELPAASYLLADLDSGNVLLGKGAHEAHLPASTMKLLTAQTLMPRLDATMRIRATDSDARVDGTRVGLVPDREYTADQLFHALLMGSANDAAEALARANGGPEVTLQQMRERAAALGARDTVPRTPHGLDAPGQQTTAYDLVAILRGALQSPGVGKILTAQTYDFPAYRPTGTATGQASEGAAPAASTDPAPAGSQQVASQNRLLWNYPGAIGGKDGYTDAAGHTYVGAVRRGEATYAVAFMGAPSNDWRPMAALLDWAFGNAAKAKPVGRLPAPVPSATAGAPAAESAAESAGGQAGSADGMLAMIGSAVLTLLKVLLWTIAVLSVAVVGLRVRKLRRDARRREARRRRVAARGADPRPMVPCDAAVPAQHPRLVPLADAMTADGVTADGVTADYGAYGMTADGTVAYGLTGQSDDSWAVHRLDAPSRSGQAESPSAKDRTGRQ